MSPNKTKKENDITKRKPLGHSEMQNIGMDLQSNTTAKVI